MYRVVQLCVRKNKNRAGIGLGVWGRLMYNCVSKEK